MENHRDLFDAAITSAIRKGLQLVAANPKFALMGAKLLYHQKKAARTRKRHAESGLIVPAVLMVSVTSRCNLRCKGCYMRAQHRGSRPDMDPDQLRILVDQAIELGTSVFILAGGEPLLRKTELFQLARDHPQELFAVFTNGLLIDEAAAREMASLPHMVPVLSFEGFRETTDLRRGNGVYDRLREACMRLQEWGIFFGCSLTINRMNYDQVCNRDFVTAMLEIGVRAFIFVEFVPIEPGTEDQVLTGSQRCGFRTFLSDCDQNYPALFVGFPGEEERYGGCLAAGRDFVHVSPSGDLEPCPAAPFSDTNLTRVPLRAALQSGFLEEIRLHHEKLTESEGGCALWNNRTWTASLLQGSPEAPKSP
jgi:MoaA/NifB/PqqE/SkfB family radical SAM enzyme